MSENSSIKNNYAKTMYEIWDLSSFSYAFHCILPELLWSQELWSTPNLQRREEAEPWRALHNSGMNGFQTKQDIK